MEPSNILLREQIVTQDQMYVHLTSSDNINETSGTSKGCEILHKAGEQNQEHRSIENADAESNNETYKITSEFSVHTGGSFILSTITDDILDDKAKNEQVCVQNAQEAHPDKNELSNNSGECTKNMEQASHLVLEQDVIVECTEHHDPNKEILAECSYEQLQKAQIFLGSTDIKSPNSCEDLDNPLHEEVLNVPVEVHKGEFLAVDGKKSSPKKESDALQKNSLEVHEMPVFNVLRDDDHTTKQTIETCHQIKKSKKVKFKGTGLKGKKSKSLAKCLVFQKGKTMLETEKDFKRGCSQTDEGGKQINQKCDEEHIKHSGYELPQFVKPFSHVLQSTDATEHLKSLETEGPEEMSTVRNANLENEGCCTTTKVPFSEYEVEHNTVISSIESTVPEEIKDEACITNAVETCEPCMLFQQSFEDEKIPYAENHDPRHHTGVEKNLTQIPKVQVIFECNPDDDMDSLQLENSEIKLERPSDMHEELHKDAIKVAEHDSVKIPTSDEQPSFKAVTRNSSKIVEAQQIVLENSSSLHHPKTSDVCTSSTSGERMTSKKTKGQKKKKKSTEKPIIKRSSRNVEAHQNVLENSSSDHPKMLDICTSAKSGQSMTCKKTKAEKGTKLKSKSSDKVIRSSLKNLEASQIVSVSSSSDHPEMLDCCTSSKSEERMTCKKTKEQKSGSSSKLKSKSKRKISHKLVDHVNFQEEEIQLPMKKLETEKCLVFSSNQTKGGIKRCDQKSDTGHQFDSWNKEQPCPKGTSSLVLRHTEKIKHLKSHSKTRRKQSGVENVSKKGNLAKFSKISLAESPVSSVEDKMLEEMKTDRACLKNAEEMCHDKEIECNDPVKGAKNGTLSEFQKDQYVLEAEDKMFAGNIGVRHKADVDNFSQLPESLVSVDRENDGIAKSPERYEVPKTSEYGGVSNACIMFHKEDILVQDCAEKKCLESKEQDNETLKKLQKGKLAEHVAFQEEQNVSLVNLRTVECSKLHCDQIAEDAKQYHQKHDETEKQCSSEEFLKVALSRELQNANETKSVTYQEKESGEKISDTEKSSDENEGSDIISETPISEHKLQNVLPLASECSVPEEMVDIAHMENTERTLEDKENECNEIGITACEKSHDLALEQVEAVGCSENLPQENQLSVESSSVQLPNTQILLEHKSDVTTKPQKHCYDDSVSEGVLNVHIDYHEDDTLPVGQYDEKGLECNDEGSEAMEYNSQHISQFPVFGVLRTGVSEGHMPSCKETKKRKKITKSKRRSGSRRKQLSDDQEVASCVKLQKEKILVHSETGNSEFHDQIVEDKTYHQKFEAGQQTDSGNELQFDQNQMKLEGELVECTKFQELEVIAENLKIEQCVEFHSDQTVKDAKECHQECDEQSFAEDTKQYNQESDQEKTVSRQKLQCTEVVASSELANMNETDCLRSCKVQSVEEINETEQLRKENEMFKTTVLEISELKELEGIKATSGGEYLLLEEMNTEVAYMKNKECQNNEFINSPEDLQGNSVKCEGDDSSVFKVEEMEHLQKHDPKYPSFTENNSTELNEMEVFLACDLGDAVKSQRDFERLETSECRGASDKQMDFPSAGCENEELLDFSKIQREEAEEEQNLSEAEEQQNPSSDHGECQIVWENNVTQLQQMPVFSISEDGQTEHLTSAKGIKRKKHKFKKSAKSEMKISSAEKEIPEHELKDKTIFSEYYSDHTMENIKEHNQKHNEAEQQSVPRKSKFPKILNDAASELNLDESEYSKSRDDERCEEISSAGNADKENKVCDVKISEIPLSEDTEGNTSSVSSEYSSSEEIKDESMKNAGEICQDGVMNNSSVLTETGAMVCEEGECLILEEKGKIMEQSGDHDLRKQTCMVNLVAQFLKMAYLLECAPYDSSKSGNYCEDSDTSEDMRSNAQVDYPAVGCKSEEGLKFTNQNEAGEKVSLENLEDCEIVWESSIVQYQEMPSSNLDDDGQSKSHLMSEKNFLWRQKGITLKETESKSSLLVEEPPIHTGLKEGEMVFPEKQTQKCLELELHDDNIDTKHHTKELKPDSVDELKFQIVPISCELENLVETKNSTSHVDKSKEISDAKSADEENYNVSETSGCEAGGIICESRAGHSLPEDFISPQCKTANSSVISQQTHHLFPGQEVETVYLKQPDKKHCSNVEDNFLPLTEVLVSPKCKLVFYEVSESSKDSEDFDVHIKSHEDMILSGDEYLNGKCLESKQQNDTEVNYVGNEIILDDDNSANFHEPQSLDVEDTARREFWACKEVNSEEEKEINECLMLQKALEQYCAEHVKCSVEQVSDKTEQCHPEPRTYTVEGLSAEKGNITEYDSTETCTNFKEVPNILLQYEKGGSDSHAINTTVGLEEATEENNSCAIKENSVTQCKATPTEVFNLAVEKKNVENWESELNEMQIDQVEALTWEEKQLLDEWPDEIIDDTKEQSENLDLVIKSENEDLTLMRVDDQMTGKNKGDDSCTEEINRVSKICVQSGDEQSLSRKSGNKVDLTKAAHKVQLKRSCTETEDDRTNRINARFQRLLEVNTSNLKVSCNNQDNLQFSPLKYERKYYNPYRYSRVSEQQRKHTMEPCLNLQDHKNEVLAEPEDETNLVGEKNQEKKNELSTHHYARNQTAMESAAQLQKTLISLELKISETKRKLSRIYKEVEPPESSEPNSRAKFRKYEVQSGLAPKNREIAAMEESTLENQYDLNYETDTKNSWPYAKTFSVPSSPIYGTTTYLKSNEKKWEKETGMAKYMKFRGDQISTTGDKTTKRSEFTCSQSRKEASSHLSENGEALQKTTSGNELLSFQYLQPSDEFANHSETKNVMSHKIITSNLKEGLHGNKSLCENDCVKQGNFGCKGLHGNDVQENSEETKIGGKQMHKSLNSVSSVKSEEAKNKTKRKVNKYLCGNLTLILPDENIQCSGNNLKDLQQSAEVKYENVCAEPAGSLQNQMLNWSGKEEGEITPEPKYFAREKKFCEGNGPDLTKGTKKIKLRHSSSDTEETNEINARFDTLLLKASKFPVPRYGSRFVAASYGSKPEYQQQGYNIQLSSFGYTSKQGATPLAFQVGWYRKNNQTYSYPRDSEQREELAETTSTKFKKPSHYSHNFIDHRVRDKTEIKYQAPGEQNKFSMQERSVKPREPSPYSDVYGTCSERNMGFRTQAETSTEVNLDKQWKFRNSQYSRNFSDHRVRGETENEYQASREQNKEAKFNIQERLTKYREPSPYSHDSVVCGMGSKRSTEFEKCEETSTEKTFHSLDRRGKFKKPSHFFHNSIDHETDSQTNVELKDYEEIDKEAKFSNFPWKSKNPSYCFDDCTDHRMQNETKLEFKQQRGQFQRDKEKQNARSLVRRQLEVISYHVDNKQNNYERRAASRASVSKISEKKPTEECVKKFGKKKYRSFSPDPVEIVCSLEKMEAFLNDLQEESGASSSRKKYNAPEEMLYNYKDTRQDKPTVQNLPFKTDCLKLSSDNKPKCYKRMRESPKETNLWCEEYFPKYLGDGEIATKVTQNSSRNSLNLDKSREKKQKHSISSEEYLNRYYQAKCDNSSEEELPLHDEPAASNTKEEDAAAVNNCQELCSLENVTPEIPTIVKTGRETKQKKHTSPGDKLTMAVLSETNVTETKNDDKSKQRDKVVGQDMEAVNSDGVLCSQVSKCCVQDTATPKGDKVRKHHKHDKATGIVSCKKKKHSFPEDISVEVAKKSKLKDCEHCKLKEFKRESKKRKIDAKEAGEMTESKTLISENCEFLLYPSKKAVKKHSVDCENTTSMCRGAELLPEKCSSNDSVAHEGRALQTVGSGVAEMHFALKAPKWAEKKGQEISSQKLLKKKTRAPEKMLIGKSELKLPVEESLAPSLSELQLHDEERPVDICSEKHNLQPLHYVETVNSSVMNRSTLPYPKSKKSHKTSASRKECVCSDAKKPRSSKAKKSQASEYSEISNSGVINSSPAECKSKKRLDVSQHHAGFSGTPSGEQGNTATCREQAFLTEKNENSEPEEEENLGIHNRNVDDSCGLLKNYFSYFSS